MIMKVTKKHYTNLHKIVCTRYYIKVEYICQRSCIVRNCQWHKRLGRRSTITLEYARKHMQNKLQNNRIYVQSPPFKQQQQMLFTWWWSQVYFDEGLISMKDNRDGREFINLLIISFSWCDPLCWLLCFS
jgi:hypothetical protein